MATEGLEYVRLQYQSSPQGDKVTSPLPGATAARCRLARREAVFFVQREVRKYMASHSQVALAREPSGGGQGLRHWLRLQYS